MTTTYNTDHRATCAYWYAVGHADATGNEDKAEDFRAFHRAQARAYYSGQVSSLHSIPDAWREFTTGATVTEPAPTPALS